MTEFPRDHRLSELAYRCIGQIADIAAVPLGRAFGELHRGKDEAAIKAARILLLTPRHQSRTNPAFHKTYDKSKKTLKRRLRGTLRMACEKAIEKNLPGVVRARPALKSLAQWSLQRLSALDDIHDFQPPKPPTPEEDKQPASKWGAKLNVAPPKPTGSENGNGKAELIGQTRQLTAGDLLRHQQQYGRDPVDLFRLPTVAGSDSDTSSTGSNSDGWSTSTDDEEHELVLRHLMDGDNDMAAMVSEHP